MITPISVDDILARVGDRARTAYTYLVTHPDTIFDDVTGWSYAYVGQYELGREMECSISTVKRALVDLRDLGLARVLAWPGARTETHVRVADIPIDSVFGPVQAARERFSTAQKIDVAMGVLRGYWADFDAEPRYPQDVRGYPHDPPTEPSTEPSSEPSR